MIDFEKYHGCGNSFIILEYDETKDYTSLAKQLCSQDVGIGSDGLMVVKQNPLEMVFYNLDGSIAPMCGNGIRCFAKYVYERIEAKERFDVVTGAGVMKVHVIQANPFRVEINMGKADFDVKKLHLSDPNLKEVKHHTLSIHGQDVQIHSVFLGTIHTIVFVDEICYEQVQRDGKAICEHPLFSEKTNVNFVCVKDRKNIQVLTYERGVGITKACGTGCCASVYYAHAYGYCEESVHVQLALGTLKITLKEDVYMEGPATFVAKGSIEEEEIC